MKERRTVREARLAAGLSVEGLSRRAGVAPMTIKRLERGEYVSIRLQSAVLIALRFALEEQAKAVATAKWLVAAA